MFTNGFLKIAKFDIAAADKEIDKGVHKIQVDTAYKWGGLAIAAYQRYLKTKDPKWLFDGDEYYHESVEHAALTEYKNPKTLKAVQRQVGPIREKSHKEFGALE